jgi:hypothetical protein
MHREGHLGSTLLLGAVAVVGLGLLEGSVATGVMILADRLPDQDHYIPDSVVRHRRQTHSVTFVVVVAFVAAGTFAFPIHLVQRFALQYNLLSIAVVSPTGVWLFVGGTTVVALFGHIATDMLTKGGGYKVKLFWPVSSWTIALGLCTSDDRWWNGILLSGGVTAFLAAVLHEIYYSVLPSLTGF